MQIRKSVFCETSSSVFAEDCDDMPLVSSLVSQITGFFFSSNYIFSTSDTQNGYRICWLHGLKLSRTKLHFVFVANATRRIIIAFYAVGSIFCFVLFSSSLRLFFRLNHLSKVRRCSLSPFSSQAVNLDFWAKTREVYVLQVAG